MPERVAHGQEDHLDRGGHAGQDRAARQQLQQIARVPIPRLVHETDKLRTGQHHSPEHGQGDGHQQQPDMRRAFAQRLGALAGHLRVHGEQDAVGEGPQQFHDRAGEHVRNAIDPEHAEIEETGENRAVQVVGQEGQE